MAHADELSCHVMSYSTEMSARRGSEGCLRPTASKELRLQCKISQGTASHQQPLNRLGSGSTPLLSPEMTSALADTLAAAWERPEPGDPVKSHSVA